MNRLATYAGLALHADSSIRAQAVSVMKRILRGVPRLRNAMLLGVAGLAARIPDDTPEVTHACACACFGVGASSNLWVMLVMAACTHSCGFVYGFPSRHMVLALGCACAGQLDSGNRRKCKGNNRSRMFGCRHILMM